MTHTKISFYDTGLILFIFQEKVIPEEDEEEEEENDSNPVKVANNHHHHNHYNGSKDNAPISTSPYDSAIEGYKSFAKSKLNGTTDNHKVNFSDDSDRSSSLSTSASTSSMSPAPTAPSSSSHRQNETVGKHDDEWEEKIETFVQPARRVSSEISDKMKQKLANFEDSKSGKEQTPVRLIEPDNSFKDKLKAFKTIESSVSESVAAPAKSMPSRRESEPNLPNIKPKVMPNHRSTSSSFMNTFQNNKFFQQVTSSLNATSQREKKSKLFSDFSPCDFTSIIILLLSSFTAAHDLSIFFYSFLSFLCTLSIMEFFIRASKSLHQLACKS